MSSANFAEIDVPPRDDRHDRPVPRSPRERRRDRQRPRPFGDDARFLRDHAHRTPRLVERHDDRSVNDPLHPLPHSREHALAAGAVHERRLPAVERARLPRRERRRGRRRRLGLRPQDPDAGSARRIALPTPARRPPPPTAAITVRTPGRSSRISSPIVAFPAMKSWSSNGCTNVPSTPGNTRSSIARQQASNGAFTIRAPSLRMRSIFVSGAVSIATTVQATPKPRAANATPWPAFPALIVQTPLLLASGDSIATAFAAPRSLNELIG